MHAEQHQQSGPDRRHLDAGYAHRRLGNALDDRPHDLDRTLSRWPRSTSYTPICRSSRATAGGSRTASGASRWRADQAAGWPLEVGLRLADGLLTVKAHALTEPEGIDPWMLMWWNSSTRLARFCCTRSREVWVHADLPAAALDERELDRLLGLVVEGAVAVREFQRARREPAVEQDGGGWLGAAGA